MSCSKKSCCSRPREEMLDISALSALGEAGINAVQTLIAIARTGISGLSKVELPGGDIAVLAQTIAALYEDRKRLQTALDLLQPTAAVDVTTGPTDVKIGFGPEKRYTLIVPVTGAIAKKELATGLRQVAAVLDPEQTQEQLPLPLSY